MRVVIFIGHHKVGSTSLQDFLSRNSVALARAGILYPAVDFEGMSLMLAAAVRNEPAGDLPINAREPHNALAFRMLADHKNGKLPPYHKGLPGQKQMIRALHKQIEFLRPETVILAAEVFANFAPAGTDLIRALAEVFPAGTEFTVMATLRRIDDYIASWHGQRLKFGHNLAALRNDGMAGYFGNIHFDYRLMLEGWFEALPQARFVLREYSAVQAAGGSIPDFVTQAGLTLPGEMEPEKTTNESLHRGVYEIARLGNRTLVVGKAGALRQHLRATTPDLGLPASGDIELFGPENRAIMLKRFAPIARYLDKKVGREPFFPDLQDILRVRPVPELEAFGTALAGVKRTADTIKEPEIRDFIRTLRTDAGVPAQ